MFLLVLTVVVVSVMMLIHSELRDAIARQDHQAALQREARR